MPGSISEFPKARRSQKSIRQARWPLSRLRLVQVLLLLGVVLIMGRLYYLQIFKGGELTRKAEVQRQQSNLLIHRGAITDRHGLPLAIDTTRYDVYVHPSLLKANVDEAATTLAGIVHLDAEKVKLQLTAGYPVITLARHLGREEVDELQALNWTGIDIHPRAFRHYPEGKLAAHVLGFVNMDTNGQGGVEQVGEDTLKNIGDMHKQQLDGHGHPIMLSHDSKPVMEITPPLGRQIELTIDNYLQHLAEKELGAMCAHSHALRGTVIMTNPQSGEILAWANYPSYDPNEYSKYSNQVRKNWSMVDVYEPGSTFKVLTVASALDLGTIRPDSTFVDNGTLQIGNRTIHNHEKGGHGAIDLLHLFIHSSNIAAAQVALTMSPQQFHRKLREFGIGQKTGVDLSAESAGLLLDHKYWRPIDSAATGFGQGAVAVTPLQLVAAVGAVANNGTWVAPHIIRRVYDPKTGVTEKWTEPNRRSVISKETAQTISYLLAENISGGTQLAGQVPGYRVAGKTGTAQKSISGGRGYVAGATVASFIGYLPAEAPQLLCLAVVDSPQTDGRWGNTIAGPVFNSICMEAARYLGIPPSKNVTIGGKTTAGRASLPPSVKYAGELAAKEAADAAAKKAKVESSVQGQ